MSKLKGIVENVKLWRAIAIVAGGFSLIVSTLVILNYIQINRLDPVNTKVINSLVERLSQNPDDEQLRQEIREFDLLARKAYFTNQWQINTGGHLILIGVVVLIISLQLVTLANKKMPEVSKESKDRLSTMQRSARVWISIGGTGLVVTALVFAFLTKHQLNEAFTKAQSAATTSNGPSVESQLGQQPVEPPKPADSNVEVADTANRGLTVGAGVSNAEASKPQAPKPAGAITQPGDYPSERQLKENFPGFRGFGGNGISYHRNIPTSWDGPSGKNILWKSAIPLPGYNSPVIWGDKVFVAGADANTRQVYCFDIHSGKLLWAATADNINGSPAQSPKVQGDTGHSAPTVTTDGKRVYAIFANGDVIAVDIKGNRVWAKNLGVPQNHYGYSSSLITYRGLLIVQYDQNKGGRLMALSSQTGDLAWSTNRQTKVSWASPVLVNTGKRMELILAADPSVASYDPETGKELWKIDCISGEVGPSVAYADGVVYALNEYASLSAIKIGDQPQLLWEDTEFLSDVPSPVATDKYLFVVTSYGTVACYDAKTGSRYWTKDFDNGFYSSPMLAEGKLYLLDKQGVLHIVRADKTFASIAENPIGEQMVSTPAFANGKILLRGNKMLYCIGR
jgi:outer membrane protein assembly factor BamB